MYSEIDFDEIAEMMELDNNIELKHQWKYFYDTLHVFGLKVFKENETEVKVKSYYMIENDTACFGGYESYGEAQEFARLEKKQHPNDTIKIVHETTITTELGEIND